MEQLLQEQGYEPGVIVSFRYVLCTFIDEAALGNGWSNKTNGSNSRYLCISITKPGAVKSVHPAGAFDSWPKRYQDLLEFLFLCFSLGFRGRYRVAAQDQGSLNRYIAACITFCISFVAMRAFPLLHQDKNAGRTLSAYQTIDHPTYSLRRHRRAGAVLFLLSAAAGQPDAGYSASTEPAACR